MESATKAGTTPAFRAVTISSKCAGRMWLEEVRRWQRKEFVQTRR
jgi:hypothetical protein